MKTPPNNPLHTDGAPTARLCLASLGAAPRGTAASHRAEECLDDDDVPLQVPRDLRALPIDRTPWYFSPPWPLRT